MNALLQIGIGLSAFALLSVLILLIGRIRRVLPILLSSVMVLGAGGFLLTGMLHKPASETKEEQVQTIGAEQMLSLASAFLLEGSPEAAEEILSEYDRRFPYDQNRRLLSARAAMLRGDYQAANGIYVSLGQSFEDTAQESALAADACASDYTSADLSMMIYLEENNKNPADYGYPSDRSVIENALAADSSAVTEELLELMEDSCDIPDDYLDCAELAVKAQDALLAEDASAISSAGEDLADLAEDNPELYGVEMIAELIIVCNTLGGDYEALIDDFAVGHNPLRDMIVAELYVNDLVDEKDITSRFESVSRGEKQELTEALEVIAEQYSNDPLVQDRIRNLLLVLDQDVTAMIRTVLQDAAAGHGEDRESQIYLTIAKVENYEGESDSVDLYIQKAIDTAPAEYDAEDEYAVAMNHIKDLIANEAGSDTEDIKNVPDYVDDVLTHVLPNGISQSIEDAGSSGQDSDAEGGESEDLEFSEIFEEQVIEVKSTVSIGAIDASDFETVRATVQISSDITDIDALREQLSVTDCGIEITDFTLKKLEYEQSNILLLCDVSGSMDVNEDSLISAVKEFINTHGEDEVLSLVTFSDSIEDVTAFGSSDAALLAAADAIYANGGTDMYSAALSCLADFEKNIHHNNVIILMTDGLDGDPRSVETIQSELGAQAEEAGIKIYTMGLGSSVDTNYLTAIAAACQGDFIYVSDQDMLDNFYEMLHAQVDSQYEIEFKAADTLSLTNRELTVSYAAAGAQDTKLYDIGEETSAQYKLRKDLSVHGLTTKFVYKNSADLTNQLKGAGFQSEYAVSVKLSGNLSYSLEATYQDANTYEVIIPAGVAVGSYDVEIAIDGKKTVIRNGFCVIDPDHMGGAEIGPYRFTSAQATENAQGDTVLSGCVTMNGWLHFVGDVVVKQHEENAGAVEIYDSRGSYVQFDSSTASGVGKFLAGTGLPVPIPAFGDLTLYNDASASGNYSEYMVDRKTVPTLTVSGIFMAFSPSASLYPDRVSLEFTGVTTMVPFQDDILTNISKTYKNNPMFNLDAAAQAIVTDKNLALVIDVGFEEAEDQENSDTHFRKMSVFGQDFGIDLNEFALLLDTIDKKFELKLGVEFDFLKKVKGIMIGFGITDFARLDWLEVGADFDVNKVIHGVPVTFSDFHFKVEDIGDAIQNHRFTDISISGSTDVSVAKVSAYAPALGKFLGDDCCLFSLSDTKATLHIWPIGIEAETTLKLFGEIQVAKAEAGVGFFPYSNYVLGIDEEDVGGIFAKVGIGVDEEISKNFSLALNGALELSAHSRFIGLGLEGEAGVEFKWWFLSAEAKAQGNIAVGIYFTRTGDGMFLYSYKTQDSGGKVKGETYYLTFDGKTGQTTGQLA